MIFQIGRILHIDETVPTLTHSDQNFYPLKKKIVPKISKIKPQQV